MRFVCFFIIQLKDMSIESIVRYSRNMDGKITIATVLFCVLVISVFFFVDAQYKGGIYASDVATTSVFVVNSPPEWTVGPVEVPASSTSSPTNEGDVVTWTATAEDPNGSNSYWLLICKDSTATETDMILYNPAVPGSQPDCPGGTSERWARSALTADTVMATATYQTLEGRVEDVENIWYAYICDNDEYHPRCNVTDVRQGVGDSGSPFYVNHRPAFTDFNSPSATNPGNVATWTSVASNTNTLLTDLTVKLFVCRTNLFDEVNIECDGGNINTYASSTYSTNPSVNYTTKHPKPDGEYDAYGFVVDAYGLSAPLPSDVNYNGQEERVQGTNAILTINNVAPTVEVGTFEFFNQDNETEIPNNIITPLNEEAETDGFRVTFETSDANSCVNIDWDEGIGTTTGHMEMTDVAVNFYRSGVGVNNCHEDGHHNPNNCYPFEVSTSSYGTEEGWGITCTLDNSGCTGNTDTSVKWECTFPLWFLVDPTDGNASTTLFFDQNWFASVVVTDDDFATSTLTQGGSGVNVGGFMAFRLDQDTITFGDLEVDARNETLDRLTTIFATGNVGIDQELEGTPMCPMFDLLDPVEYGCTVYDPETGAPEDTIPARFQRFAKDLITAYGSGTQLADVTASGLPAFLALNVPKTISLTETRNEDIGWGIEIHTNITRAGNYLGQNTFIGTASHPSNW